jgi:hypothetical protein
MVQPEIAAATMATTIVAVVIGVCGLRIRGL